MSLAEDFNMYYGNTYVGLPDRNGVVMPFWVTGISRGRDFNNNDYGEDAVKALKFSGIHFTDQGDEEKTVVYTKLVLEMPELGYFNYQGRNFFLTWRPTRSTKKGMCDRRIAGTNQLTSDFVKQIYKTVHAKPDSLSRQFLTENGKVRYKGYVVGNVENQLMTILKKFKYIVPYLKKVVGNDYVVEEEV
ncbi:hypothetical protein APT65_00106 [Trabzonvirus APT65]|uniref:Uncharacterized protein n=1 Tax=Aeromonas phage APT65 TaxID=2982914 RepID=A0A9E8K2D9_9CAUD|nr:hypothetical protein APT65_00106 [Aeromonas phage APT65]